MIQPITCEETRGELTGFFGWMPWTWFVTLDLKNEATLPAFEKQLKKWRRTLFNKAKGQVAYEGVFINGSPKHAHLLVMSKPNKNGQSLADMPAEDVRDLEQYWYSLAGRPAKILPVWSSEGVAAYITSMRNISSKRWELVQPCGINLINRLKRAA